MKITPEQLKSQLNKQRHPLYFIHGDTTLLVNEACDSIRLALKHNGFQDRQIFQLERGFDWHKFLAACANRSLFSQKRLFELRLGQTDIGANGRKHLKALAEKPPKDIVLIITSKKLASSTTTSSWYKAIDKVGVTLPIWPINLQQFPQWLRTRMQQQGLTTDMSGIQLLTEATQGNLLAAHQEIEKLHLLYGQGTLSVDQIADSCHDNARFNVFELADTVLAGNTLKARRMLKSLQAENAEPILTLWALTKDTRDLICMAEDLQHGQSIVQATQSVWAKRKPLMQNVLRKVTLPQLYQRLQTAHQIDKQLKGVSKGNVWQSLTDFVTWKLA